MESKKVEGVPVASPYDNESDCNQLGTFHSLYQSGEPDNRQGDGHMGKYRRSFQSRHIQFISLGSNIGSGVFISTGKALRNTGPGNMIIGYAVCMTMVIAVLQTLTEMTVAFPVSGNVIDFADRFIDPAVAFALGFGEWLAWTTVLASEGAAFNVVVQYWTDAVPVAAWMTIILLITYGILACPNRVYAEVQYVISILKVLMLLVIIFSSIAMLAGAGPKGTVYDGEYYRDLPVFLHNVKGTCLCAIYAIWGVGDQVYIGIMAGEAENPRHSMPRTVKTVGLRVFGFFMVIVVFITLLVPETDPDLLSGSGAGASPIVIALNHAGIRGVPDLLNAIFLVISGTGGLEPLFIATRVMRHMALAGQLPQQLAHVDDRGRPLWALAVTAAFSVIFTYINCSSTGSTIFTWFSSMCSAIYMVVWIIIPICSFRFHAAIREQKSTILDGRYAYRASLWPLAPVFLGATAFLVLIGLFAASLWPVDGKALSPYYFFETYLGVPILLVAFLGYKIFYRTRFRRASEIDLVSGYMPLSEENKRFFDDYYSQSMSKRIWSYFTTTHS